MLFLRRKLGLALRGMGSKVPFCRYQFMRKRWVQVQRKTLQSRLTLFFCHRMNFSLISATGLIFLLCGKTFCYAIKLSAVQQNLLLYNKALLCSNTFCYAVKLSALFCNVNDYFSFFFYCRNTFLLPTHKQI